MLYPFVSQATLESFNGLNRERVISKSAKGTGITSLRLRVNSTNASCLWITHCSGDNHIKAASLGFVDPFNQGGVQSTARTERLELAPVCLFGNSRANYQIARKLGVLTTLNFPEVLAARLVTGK